jgi:hypothetical protein
MKHYRLIAAIILISTLLSACGSPQVLAPALPAVGQAAFSALYTAC